MDEFIYKNIPKAEDLLKKYKSSPKKKKKVFKIKRRKDEKHKNI